MKLESNSSSSAARFSEQVNKVIELFQGWNDCERSVSLYAVLKRIPFSCTKFLQSVIATNLTQAYCLEQTKLLEHNANSATFIRSLGDAYKNFVCCTHEMQLNKDSIFFESDRLGVGAGSGVASGSGGIGGSGSLNDIADKYYDKKEDILNDILTLMPILTPGNDEAKCAYLEFIPMTVEDAIRGKVNTTLVQQIFSYLLIHPAFTTDDRRSVSKYLRHFEDHIVSSDPNFIIYPNNGPSPTSEPANSTTASSTNWQAIAPPQSKSTETIISWDSQHHLTGNGGKSSSQTSYVDDVNEYRKSLSSLIDFKPAPGSSPKLGHLYESGTDDHHISFSKNGTVIDDCDDANNKSNTQIGFDTLANLNEFLTVPGVIDNITLKTRRSNSLTTTGTLPSTACTSSSVHNLSSLLQKPRSFSLSMVSPRSSLTSSGSDTRLDDFKPNYAKFTPHNVGMAGIGQWLKSLRLHKYVWLFSNITYDQMLDISEEYLQKLNVTKGARHKLVVCIQKLKDRHSVLVQLEKDLLTNHVQMVVALEELTGIVLTPMKPVEHFNKNDVGGQFLKVLNLVSTMMTTKIILPLDEEPINSLLWILEKAVHNEAFVAHTNQLKEHRFKVSRIKIQFPPKSHYGNKPVASTSSGSLTRSRFASLQHLDMVEDSDYQSMSSKSNSTESLISPLPYPNPTDCETFNRAVGKKSTNTKDFSTPEEAAATPKHLSTENIFQAPLVDTFSNHPFFFGTNCAQLKDFINVPKLSEVYSPKNMIGFEADLNAAVAKISDFIINNKSVAVDLTTNRLYNRPDTVKTTKLVDITEMNFAKAFVPTSPKFNLTSKVKEQTPNAYDAEVDLMTFPETNFFHETPVRNRNRPSGKEALETELVSLKSEPESIEFAKLNFGSSFSNIFKPKSSLKQIALLRNEEKTQITPKVSNQSTQPREVLRNPTSTSSMRSSNSLGSTIASGFSKISIASGIGSTCGSSISSSRSTFIGKPQVESTKPQYAAIVIQGRGMTGIPVWLKSLRLHKYTYVFVDMSYERMLSVTEAYLEQLNITKGARNKLALSIAKLNERFNTMDCIEKGLLNGTCVTALALEELATVVQTPMKPADPLDERDVASKFMRVVNLVFDRITGPVLVRPDEQSISKFAWILERAVYNEGCSAHTTHLRKMRLKFGDRKNVR